MEFTVIIAFPIGPFPLQFNGFLLNRTWFNQQRIYRRSEEDFITSFEGSIRLCFTFLHEHFMSSVIWFDVVLITISFHGVFSSKTFLDEAMNNKQV